MIKMGTLNDINQPIFLCLNIKHTDKHLKQGRQTPTLDLHHEDMGKHSVCTPEGSPGNGERIDVCLFGVISPSETWWLLGNNIP